MREDDRKQNTKNPNIDLKGFIYKNYKDIIAFSLIIFFVSLLVFKSGISERVETILISLTSGAAGFIFGKRVE